MGGQLRAKVHISSFMTPIPAEVVAAEKQGVHYQVIVQIAIPKYRGSFNTLVFGERKPLLRVQTWMTTLLTAHATAHAVAWWAGNYGHECIDFMRATS